MYVFAGAGNAYGSTWLSFYTGVVLAQAAGQPITFERAKCKPRVRDGKASQSGSERMKALEEARKGRAIRKVLKENPTLAEKYSVEDCKVRMFL